MFKKKKIPKSEPGIVNHLVREFVYGRFRGKLGMALISILLIAMAMVLTISPLFRGEKVEPINLLYSAILLSGGFMLLNIFLTPNSKGDADTIESYRASLIQAALINQRHAEAIKENQERQKSMMGSEDNTTLKSDLPNDIENLRSLVNTAVNMEFEKIREPWQHENKAERSQRELNNRIAAITSRLFKQIESLEQRSTLNLILGVATTASAGVILFLTIRDSISTNNLNETILYFAPRLSLVVLTEAFSFFFLRMYRSNFLDITYYQNELTNAEFKTLALTVAIQNDDKATINKVILELVKIERNFILKKGETTKEIELLKFQSQNDPSLTENLKTLVDAINNKTTAKTKKVKQMPPKGPN